MLAEGKQPSGNRNSRRVAIYLESTLVGILSGLIIVLYRLAIASLQHARTSLLPLMTESWMMMVLWLLVAAGLGLLTALMVRSAPYIKGSGIPQVKAFLMRRINFRWQRELPFKFIGGSLALGTGMSLGREGPSIQLGALIGTMVCQITRHEDDMRFLVTAGAAAGISAAFNAPLAGVLFCIEELHRNVSPTMLTSALIASFSANVVVLLIFGATPVFGITVIQVLPVNLYFSTILFIGLLTGILGGLFNAGLLHLQTAYQGLVPSETLRIVSAFLVAAIISVVLPSITGGGDHMVASLVRAEFPFAVLLLLLACKFVFTLVSYGSGSPGGIFLPMLALGAMVGAAAQGVFQGLGITTGYLNNFILLGMVGFFTAVVRAPITGAVLITEMAGSFAHFPAFILVSVIASFVAIGMRSRPIYDSLLARIAPGCQDDGRSRPVTLHIPLAEGSVLESIEQARALMPEGCILTAVERGEEELYPGRDLALHPGDVLHVVVELGKAHHRKEQLLALGQPSADSVDGD
ncbi:MAG TPA: ClC family H(+)/Cl(-) exchange transporter [bacterium]|nr:ClC family H(+)/Cl(-) exchange transporter [bacterium]